MVMFHSYVKLLNGNWGIFIPSRGRSFAGGGYGRVAGAEGANNAKPCYPVGVPSGKQPHNELENHYSRRFATATARTASLGSRS